MSLSTVSFDPIEKRRSLEHSEERSRRLFQLFRAGAPWESKWRCQFRNLGRDKLDLGRNMSYGTLQHSYRREPSSETRVLCEIVDAPKCALDLMTGLAPPRLEDEARSVMDRLMREYLKPTPLAQ
jgi:hypothetical protein